MCGGVSASRLARDNRIRSSPRVWGCFFILPPRQPGKRVFPTCVGVFLDHLRGVYDIFRLPHVCGGVSDDEILARLTLWSSPRVWGCFLTDLKANEISMVFPTCVGVFLESGDSVKSAYSLPHVCGGVSDTSNLVRYVFLSSPRVWGCFFPLLDELVRSMVFPTCVGVFLVGIIAWVM